MLDTLKSVVTLFGRPMDPDTVQEPDAPLMRLAVHALAPLAKYFRMEVKGLDNMPEGKALVVGNHNAGITFLEPMFLGAEWYKRTGGRDDLYFLAHDAMVALPVVGNLLMKLGSIRASHQTARRAFEMGRKVVVFPGGNYEAFRPFSQRYQVDFGGKKGFVKLAIRNQVPIVPLLSIGGHETFFVLHRGKWLAEALGVKKYLRSESFPIFLGLPWGIGIGPIFHLPLPAKCLVEVGESIPITGYAPEDVNDPAKLQALYDQVEGAVQAMMDRRAADRKVPLLG
jgi:1-acyl-sn-glycerol-3-phosphate acyltransferase